MTSHCNLDELMQLIDEPNRQKCLQLFDAHRDQMLSAPGSQIKHQAWPGGYADHLKETMNFACDLYAMMSDRELPFSLSDALLVLFFHDIEKPFKYTGTPGLHSDTEKKVFLDTMVRKYEISLTPEHENALRYAHGEGDDYHPTERVQGPLGAFIHMCDVASARIWFGYPKR